jgi:predicted nucleotidyltransferase
MDKEQIKVVNEIKNFLKKVSGVFERVILSGSYARGDYSEDDSDVDLIIVSNEFKKNKSYKRGVELYNLWYSENDIDVDFVCLTPEEFDAESKIIGVIKYAIRDGIVIK